MSSPVAHKPHGKDCPTRCSQCAGVVVRRVTIADGSTFVDGEKQPEPRPSEFVKYGRRDGKTRKP